MSANLDQQDRLDTLEIRAEQAGAVLDVLLMAITADDPPLPEVVARTVSAARALLTI